MDEKYRHLLERNHYLLTSNITLTDEMYDKLTEMNVLTRTMIQDVKSKEAGERVAYMLELLTKRPKAAYKQFCSVLQICNHSFLSDHMLQEEAFPQSDGVNINDLFWRVPSLQKHIHNKEKDILLTYVQQKVREEVNKSQWQSSPAMKASAMTIRANQIDQIEKYKGLLVQKEAQAHSLEVRLKDAEQGAARETHRLQDNLKALRNRYDNDVTIQMRHAEAGERSIHRLSDNLFHLENQVWAVNKLIRKSLGEAPEDIEWDPLNKSTETLETNINALIEKYSNLKTFSSEIETVNDKDKIAVLNLLKIHKGSDIPIIDIIEEYTETLNKAMDDTISELNKLDQSLRPKSLDFKFITEINEIESNADMKAFHHFTNKPITSTIIGVKRELNELIRRGNELQNELHDKEVKIGDLNNQIVFLQSELSKTRSPRHNLLDINNRDQRSLSAENRFKLPSLSPAGTPLTSPFVTPDTSPVLSRRKLSPNNHTLPLNSPPPQSIGLIDVTISPRSDSHLRNNDSHFVTETSNMRSSRQRTLSFDKSDRHKSTTNNLSPRHVPMISRSPSPRRKLKIRDGMSPNLLINSPQPSPKANRKLKTEDNGSKSMTSDEKETASLTNICFDSESANHK
ncbi:unnamed protein product [Owenia fusiformis]|uniref:Uncharacterized protein n=1 Tax=Owenia fusiformis TaxID=6347 RepID=A0A8J1UT10_OWEFU|nr:unnamed protein product [Owenia fusiformis]